MRVELRMHGGPAHLVDLDVELEVRHARLFADDELRYAPWSGDRFVRLGDLPSLAEAFESPEARFAAHLRTWRFPRAAVATAGLVALVGAAQVSLMVAGALDPALDAGLSGALLRGAIGYEPLLLEGAWWSPWTSQLLHAGAVHLAMNLPVLAYCGYRVERALGVGGFSVVAAAAVLGGSAAVTAFGSLPVVGASILAYGLWGAQIAIGLRMGEAVPPGWRGYYGWGNLVLFAPLFVSGLAAEGVSDLGHLGGLAGGVLAALFVRAESLRPADEERARRGANLRLAVALATAPMLVGPAVARVAPGLVATGEPVEVAEAGATLALPWRMADNPARFGGLPAWVVSRNHHEPLFVGIVRLDGPRAPSAEELAAAWGETLDARLTPTAAPAPLGEAWTTNAWLLREDASDAVTGRLVEHTLRRGRWLWRVGYRVDADAGAGREALYTHVLESVALGEPPALTTARRELTRRPEDPERAWSYAHELGQAGLVEEADAAWVALAARPDGWRWEAVRGRVALWDGVEPVEASALDRHVGGPERAAWVARALAEAPTTDAALHRAGVARLVTEGACDAAATHVARVDGIDAELAANLAEVAVACRPGGP